MIGRYGPVVRDGGVGVLWRVVEDGVHTLAAGEGHLVVVFDEWTTAFDAATGDERWSVLVPHGGSVRLAILDGRVYLGVDDRHRVLSLVTGEDDDAASWRELRGWPPLRHHGYHVEDDEVVAEGLTEERWRAPAGGEGAVAVGAGDVVLVSNRSGLRVLDGETGELLGEIRVRADFDPRPAISDGTRAWVALVDGSVWGLSLTGEGDALPEPDAEPEPGPLVERVPLDRLAGALGLAPNDPLARRAATRTIEEPAYLSAIIDWAGACLAPTLGPVEPIGSTEVTPDVASDRGAWLSTAWDVPPGPIDVDLSDERPDAPEPEAPEPGTDGLALDGLAIGDPNRRVPVDAPGDGRSPAPSIWRHFAEAAAGAEPVRHRRHLLVTGSEALAFHADEVPIDRYGSPFGYLTACGVAEVRTHLWRLGSTALDVAAGVSQEEPYRRPSGWDGRRAETVAGEAMLRTPTAWEDPFGDGLGAVRGHPDCGWPALEQWLVDQSGGDDVEPVVDEARSVVAGVVPEVRLVLRLQVLALLAAAAVARVAAQLPPGEAAELLDRARRSGRQALTALVELRPAPKG